MVTAWVFAGHGAQYVGMGRTILRDTEAGRRWLAAAESASLLPLGQLAAQGPAHRLADPSVLEPLLAAISGAYTDLLLAREGTPTAVAAYSAGHVAALYAADVIDRATCIQIACIRGAALAHSAHLAPGGMVSVHGLPEEQLIRLAEDDASDPASVAARNAPMYVVYSGTETALSRAIARATAAGATTRRLEVAGPWHSPWLESTRREIQTAIAALPFRPARMQVWSTVTTQATQDPEQLRWAVSASIARTVEWHGTVMAMCNAGIDTFVEVSPGRTLWGLLGQMQTPHSFTRRYLEGERGPIYGSVASAITAANKRSTRPMSTPVLQSMDGHQSPAMTDLVCRASVDNVIVSIQAISAQEPA